MFSAPRSATNAEQTGVTNAKLSTEINSENTGAK